MDKPDKIIPMPERETVKQQAAAWVARMDTRALTQAEKDEFKNWKAQSPIHAEEYDRFEEVWSNLDILDDLNYLEQPDKSVMGRQRIATLPRIAILTAIAATLLLMFSVSVFDIQTLKTVPLLEASYSTEVGEQETVTLADGSVMILNTDSIVDIRFDQAVRDIYLRRGEAHFEVAANPERPFTVFAGENVVRATGTAFSVYFKDEDNVEVIVSEGRVQLMSKIARQPGADDLLAETLKPLLEVSVGENAIFGKNAIKYLEELPTQDLNRKLSWRRGLLSFKGDTLPEVVTEITRYTDVNIEIADENLNALKIGGYFKVGEVDAFLRALEASFDIDIEQVSEQSFILRQ